MMMVILKESINIIIIVQRLTDVTVISTTVIRNLPVVRTYFRTLPSTNNDHDICGNVFCATLLFLDICLFFFILNITEKHVGLVV